MATKHRSSSALAVRHRAPMVSKRKFEGLKAAGLARAKRAREVAARRTGTIVGGATAGLVGYLEKTGRMSPKFSSPVAFAGAGFVLSFVLPETGMGKGKLGQMSAEAGSALLAVGCYKAGLGQPMIGDDDGVEGDWSDGD